MASVASPSERLRIRGERWSVLRSVRYDGCTVVDVAGAETANRGRRTSFILPFDRFDRLPDAEAVPRVVTSAAWRRTARAALAEATPCFAALRAAASARLGLLPFQLEPAMAMTRGLACRFLLADAVGLGKTVQAGLMIAELLSRDPEARILVVTPASLREQWCGELRDRFHIDAGVVDAAALARDAARLPPGANPWRAARVAVTSIDFLKRPDVIRALEPLVWDLVAFDEAHALVGRSDRAAAADLVAGRGRCVVTITATPHGGDDRGFARLCAIGRLGTDERLLLFRRSRTEAGVPDARSMRIVRVRPSSDERKLHERLRAYATRVVREAPGEWAAAARLAMIVLDRRACSSAWSLARSLERRMALLAEPFERTGEQLRLPIDSPATDDEPGAELAAPGLPDVGAEQRMLKELADAADGIGQDCKLRVLVRFLRRCAETAIVFTEYRDTLRRVAAALAADAPLDEAAIALLHGGLTQRERIHEVQRFTQGGARWLLATDAASEGLNLHQRCRLVINLDIPWTPLRLEQRVGRVDRLGQPRRVHALVLATRGTSDDRAVKRLASRAAQARRGAPFDAVAPPAPPWLSGADLKAEAEREARRLGLARALAGGTRPHASPRRVLAVLRRGGRRRLCLALRLTFVDGDGGLLWQTLAAACVDFEAEIPAAGREVRAWAERLVRQHACGLAAASGGLHEQLAGSLRDDLAACLGPPMAREEAILARLRGRGGRLAAPLVQAGLFDRRALRDAAAQRRIEADAARRAEERIARLARLRSACAGERRLAFAVVL